MQLFLDDKDEFLEGISPLREAAAYENLWLNPTTSFKKIADKFRRDTSKLSLLVDDEDIEKISSQLLSILRHDRQSKAGVIVKGTYDYPSSLLDAANPLEIIYYSGNWDLSRTPGIAIVGSRQASAEGIKRARKLTKLLVKDGFTIISGLAEGIDTTAHTTAIEEGGKTIAVIGTPLSHVYPKHNDQLQQTIARDHLVISQVPFYRYEKSDYRTNRYFFPERNITMSALSIATVIVEASDTSGTLTQARAALSQGRKLFILDSCFERQNITWPEKFQKRGAIRVKQYEDIRSVLMEGSHDGKAL